MAKEEFACQLCDFVGKSKAGLMAHIRSKHPEVAKVELTEKKDKMENFVEIPNLKETIKVIEEEDKRYALYGFMREDEQSPVFINGEPKILLDDKYVDLEDSQVVFQTRKVVREYLKLQNLINKQK